MPTPAHYNQVPVQIIYHPLFCDYCNQESEKLYCLEKHEPGKESACIECAEKLNYPHAIVANVYHGPSRKFAAAELGKIGGLATSERKAQAVRENGRLGGRPRQAQPTSGAADGGESPASEPDTTE